MTNRKTGLQRIEDATRGKKVLYITTKNLDYIRVQQELTILKNCADDLHVVSSAGKSYLRRLPVIYWKILTFHHSYDAVFIGFAPQLVIPLFWWKFTSRTVIIDFFISLYDTVVFDRKLVGQRSMPAALLKYIDRLTLKKGDLVICDTHEHEKYFIDELGADPATTTVLYLDADSRYYTPRKVSRPAHLAGKYIVLYFGSVLPLQGVDVVIDAASRIDSDDIHFIIIGPVGSAQKRHSTRNTTYIDWLSQEDLAEQIGCSDLCLAGHFSDEIEKAKRVIPGKAYIYEAMNKKMVLGDNPANRERYPSTYDNVVFVEMGNDEALAEVILQEKAASSQAKETG